MAMNVFAAKPSLRSASRLPALSSEMRISGTEIACLVACGIVAAVAIGFGNQIIRGVPGHAILRGVLPMAFGLALVPRRTAGITMSFSAGVVAAAMSWQGLGRFQPAAVLGVLLLGPVLDAALAGRPQGWRLYARFIAAGAIANLLAFALRLNLAYFGWEVGGGGGGAGGREFMTFWSPALIAFILCGAMAGLVSAAIWFRLRVNNSR
jgi:hypothetical protein